jgi:iron-regulated transporter 1
MIAFLSQYSGFSTPLIAGLRAIAIIVGLAATFAAPRLIRAIGPVRAGLWSLSWQTVILAPAVVASFIPVSRSMQGGLLVGFVSVSRLGLWGFDLCEQLLVQQVQSLLTLSDAEEIETSIRGEFSTTESALQSVFDLCQYLSTIVFSTPDMFKVPVTMSFVSVASALAVYAIFVRKRRGHLVHIYEKIHSEREG